MLFLVRRHPDQIASSEDKLSLDEWLALSGRKAVTEKAGILSFSDMVALYLILPNHVTE